MSNFKDNSGLETIKPKTSKEERDRMMKQFLDKLNAFHESEHFYKGRYDKIDKNIKYPSALHPLVRTHPVTKKRHCM